MWTPRFSDHQLGLSVSPFTLAAILDRIILDEPVSAGGSIIHHTEGLCYQQGAENIFDSSVVCVGGKIAWNPKIAKGLAKFNAVRKGQENSTASQVSQGTSYALPAAP